LSSASPRLRQYRASGRQPHLRRRGGARRQPGARGGQAGIAGLEFYRGVPGAVGGACVMNAGLLWRRDHRRVGRGYAVDRTGERVVLTNAQMDFSYRKSKTAAEAR